jgi:hypothetical protein
VEVGAPVPECIDLAASLVPATHAVPLYFRTLPVAAFGTLKVSELVVESHTNGSFAIIFATPLPVLPVPLDATKSQYSALVGILVVVFIDT